jgi:5'/3'-nucleotidase
VRILITNDDGVDSPGIRTLARVMRPLGEVTVVAPDRERSAASHSLTLHKPLRVESLGRRFYSVSGTPTDCVNLATNGILKARPDLVLSGINKGGNLGDDITYSGTVSGAMEGTILGIPSLAVSQLGEAPFHFEPAARLILQLARLIRKNGLPPDTLLNVNVPNLPAGQIKGVRITCLGKRIFDTNTVIRKTDPRGKAYFWIGGNRLNWEPRENTDQEAVEKGYASITPLHLDLTNYSALDRLKDWEDRLNRRKV